MSEQVDTNVPESNIPEPSEVEVKARTMGWVPKEEWDGTGKWRDAEEFVDRGELFEKINSQRKKLKDLEDNQRAFTQHLNTVRKAEYSRALAAIRAEKKAALADGDADKLIEADEKLLALQAHASQVEAAPAPTSSEPHAEFVAWQARNPWYSDSNRAMKAFADVEGMKYQAAVAAGEMTPAAVLREIEAQVRKEFPEKFFNPNRSKPGAVEATRGGSSPKGESYQLNEDEHRVMTRLVKSGIITKEKYIADLKAAKGIK